MNRNCRVLGWLTMLVILFALHSTQALGQATINNPQCLATNVNGEAAGTDNTQYIFRANITFGAPTNAPAPLPGLGVEAAVYIDPFDPNNPELGAAARFPMTNIGGDLYIVYVAGNQMNGGSGGPLVGGRRHRWSIVARNNSTGGTFMNGIGAAPKPAANLYVYVPQFLELLPVDESWLPDKRTIPGQLGNGLRVDPVDPTSPNDGSSAHIYTWRVRYKQIFNTALPGGLPPQFWVRRTPVPGTGYDGQPWRDTRSLYDVAPPLVRRYNSGVFVVLISPTGQRIFCPMEIDPDAPGQGGLHAATYTTDPNNPNSLLWPTGGTVWNSTSTGVFFRYRMVPTQYVFNHGTLRGEGPFSAFGGPTLPDQLPAIPIGYGAGADGEFAPNLEIIGRPYANLYTSFAGPDILNFWSPTNPVVPNPFPYYTDTAGRSGQWRYYFASTNDLRPPQRPGFGNNGSQPTYPVDLYGADPDGYLQAYDSDNGANPVGDPTTAYMHPFVTPILSDGGWTDDLPENGYTNGTGSNSHRSRVTSKTRVRFAVRVTKADNSPLPAQAVRVYIDGTPFTMQQLPAPGNNDFIQGIVFYYDTTFGAQSQQGQHWIYFEFDDGIHKAIWPRRDTPVNGTGDGRYPDLQAALIPTLNNPTNFPTGIVGKNYLNEPLVNRPPVLSNPSLSPPSGSIGQAFTYEVDYLDLDNDEPLDADVVIDGVAHRMTPINNNAPNVGRRYRYVGTLIQNVSNQHTYYFRFRDNWNRLAAYNISPIRREFGEWTTLPQGDENGNPSNVISGPIIIGNNPAELTDPSFTFSDPSQTPATLWDFTVRYKDADNNPPANIKVYLSPDGVNFDAGTALVPAESSTNYVTGVQYHLPTRIRLAQGGPYIFRFVASDGVQSTDTTLVHVGTGANALSNSTAHQLALMPGFPNVYGDPNPLSVANSTRNWLNDPATIFVWRKVGTTTTLLTNGVDYTVDTVNGTVTLTTPTTGQVFASYFYMDTVGPLVKPNNAPVLLPPDPGNAATNDGTLTPLQGSPSTQFTYKVIYKDQDNQPPAYVNVVIDTNNTLAMAPVAGTPNPPDYRAGVTYTVQTTLQVGNHNYHFETSDGADTGRYPLTTANPNQLTGPSVADIGNLQTPVVNPFPKGKSDDLYIFTVTYKNANGLAPQFPIEMRLTPQGGTTTNYTLNPIDPIGPAEYTNGVRYQTSLQAPSQITPGQYQVTFGFQGQGAATSPLSFTVNGRPVLSNPTALPSPASQAGDITFSVTYTDVNNDPPTAIQLFIDGTQYTAVAPTSSGNNYSAGVTYQWKVQAKNLSVGNHKFYFYAKDDLEDANPANVPTPPGGDFTVAAAQQPILEEPGGDATNNNGTLTPLVGAQNATYTFSVRWKHGDGVVPVTINVVIDPGTANQRIVALTSTVPNPTPAQLQAGVVYSAQVGGLSGGAHKYKFTASDRLTSVELPAVGNPPYNGPTVNFPPVLSNGTAFTFGTTTPPTVTAQNALNPPVKGSTLSGYVFEVKYTDQDFNQAAPPVVSVTINGSQTITLKPKPGDPLNYANGVVYSTQADSPNGVTLTAGAKTFHFDASDTLDTARLPATGEITGLTVANIPSLGPINTTGDDGTLSPRIGPLSTVFTYKVKYTNLDGTAPAYVRVIIDDNTPNKQTINMTKVGTSNNYAAGVEYQATYRFNSGTSHTYRFEAEDTVTVGYVAKFPADGSSLNGPSVNVPTFMTPTFNPTNPQVGNPVTITSQLISNQTTQQPISIQLIRPDGTGITASATTDTAGGFTYTFTPTQSGDWKVRFSWGGVTGVYDPITAEFPFKVAGFTTSLATGELDMISPVLIPVTPDPAITFNVTDLNDNPLSITVLNLIKWVPNGDVSGSGRYSILNQDGDFPGITGGQSYWVRPTQNIKISPRGRLWDQTQPYVIPLQVGWNMIGSVYLQDINWSAVKVRFQGQDLPIGNANGIVRSVAWTFNKGTNGYDVVTLPDGVLKTGRGYWVRALQNADLVLQPPGTRAAEIGRDALERSDSLQIVARVGNNLDTGNYAPLSAAGKSRLALMEKPPYVGDYVTVRFVPTESVTLPAATRAAADAGQNVIAFEVDTTFKNADVSLQFPNLSSLGRKHEITLIDLSNSTSRALGTTAAINYNTGENNAPRRFALAITNVTLGGRFLITDPKMTGRGNAISFSYNISAPATVRAQIIAGSQVVRDLDRGRVATRGVNSLVWDGRDNKGASVPSGQYMLKLTASDDQGRQASITMPVLISR